MKKTAVEWLVIQLHTHWGNEDVSFEKLIEQAKEMEKEQIVNAFLLLIKEYKNKELPNCNKPFHHEAEISSGLDGLVNYIKNKQD